MIKKKLITIKTEARNFYITWLFTNITNSMLVSIPIVWVLYMFDLLPVGTTYGSIKYIFLVLIPCAINLFIGFKRYPISEEYYERTKDELQINLISLLKAVATVILYYVLSLNKTGNDNTFITYIFITLAGIIGGFLKYKDVLELIVFKYRKRCRDVRNIYRDSEWSDYFKIEENEQFLLNHHRNKEVIATILNICENQKNLDLLKKLIIKDKIENLNKVTNLILIEGLSTMYDTVKTLNIFNLDEEDRNSSIINWLKKEYELGYRKEAINVWKDLKENKRYSLEKTKSKNENIDPIMLLIDMGAKDDKPKTKKVSKI